MDACSPRGLPTRFAATTRSSAPTWDGKPVLLAVEELHAHYGKSHILHGVSLQIDAGEIVCLLGRNGVGKSTTLKSIMGLVRPSRGRVLFKERAIEGLPPYRVARLGLGYVPEERRIFPTITVRENLLMGIKGTRAGNGARENGWTLERVYEFFPRLKERERQRAGTLSGGEQQMLTMGRTLMGNPDLLLVDEPTEGLAPMIVEQVERILQAIHAGGTPVLLVEQSMETALALAERVYVMSKGQIVFQGSVRELQESDTVRKQYRQRCIAGNSSRGWRRRARSPRGRSSSHARAGPRPAPSRSACWSRPAVPSPTSARAISRVFASARSG